MIVRRWTRVACGHFFKLPVEGVLQLLCPVIRDDLSPAPWTKEGKEIIEREGFTCLYPDGYDKEKGKKRKGDEDDDSEEEEVGTYGFFRRVITPRGAKHYRLL